MRRSLLALGSLCVLALAASAALRHDEFFNGKSLDGFEGLKEYWSIQDGALVGSTMPAGIKFNTFLCSKKAYGDFELAFKVKLEGGSANSGVQIRSSIDDPAKFVVKGPQCDMGQIYWGSLFGEKFGGMMKQAPTDLVKQALKPNDFNDYRIRCVGKKVTIKLNGQTTVDGEFEKMPDRGIIAFQLHGGAGMKATFKDMVFHEIK